MRNAVIYLSYCKILPTIYFSSITKNSSSPLSKIFVQFSIFANACNIYKNDKQNSLTLSLSPLQEFKSFLLILFGKKKNGRSALILEAFFALRIEITLWSMICLRIYSQPINIDFFTGRCDAVFSRIYQNKFRFLLFLRFYKFFLKKNYVDASTFFKLKNGSLHVF